MDLRGDKSFFKNILLLSIFSFILIVSVGGASGAVPGSYCDPVGSTTSCGIGNCASGTQECLAGNVWGDCPTEGNPCGTCLSQGCGQILNLFYGGGSFPWQNNRFYQTPSGDLTCNGEGQCINTCSYADNVCADNNLIDIPPWASCFAPCDQDLDCPDTNCDYLDGCYGQRLKDCKDVLNDCNLGGDCACENNVCPDVSTCNNAGTDNDQDGWDKECGDCDDTNPNTYPEAPELCDNKDNDCDGSTDEDLTQSCGESLCLGMQTCTEGLWGDCSSLGITCEDAICDSSSNCDGHITQCSSGGICDVEVDEDSACEDLDCGTCCICSNEGRSYDSSQNNDCSDTICLDGCNIFDQRPQRFFYFADDVSNFCFALDTCTQNQCIYESECSQECGAVCEEDSDCEDTCGIEGDEDTLYSNGVCDLLECDCSWDTSTDCNDNDCENPENWECRGVGSPTLAEYGDDYTCISEEGGAGCEITSPKIICSDTWTCSQDNQCSTQECGDATYICHNGIWITEISMQEDCTNEIDDDCDGLIDCADPDCGDLTHPETLKMYGQPRFPVEIKTDNLCYKDSKSGWQCYETLAPALEGIGYTELPRGNLVYKERGPVLEIIVNISGLKSETDYQLTLNGRNGNDGNYELGNNCNNPNGPKEGYNYAWECGTWNGGTGEEGFWNFDMTATSDKNGNYEKTYFLLMPSGHYGVGPDHDFGFGFIVKEAADVPGGNNYPPVLMEMNGLDWYIEPYTYPLWINSKTPITLSATDSQGSEGECVSGVDETYYRITQVDNSYCLNPLLCYSESQGSGEFSVYEGIINIEQSSCHLIEYYSTDKKGNPEEVKKQCVFVDNEPPVTNKTVGEVKTKWLPNEADDDTEVSYFYPEETAHCWVDGTGAPLDEEACRADPMCIECWKITLETPINMECYDPAPHPVGFEELCFKVDWDGDDVTPDYCQSYEEFEFRETGYCCGNYNITEFYFDEESEHNLEYYCVDRLGNIKYDDEKFKVFGRMWPIDLYKKWNLISVPFDPINKSPEAVFDAVKEDVNSVWSYDSEMQRWYVYRPSAEEIGTNDLEKIETGLGYWVMALDDTTLNVGGSLLSPGPIVPPSQKMISGWNLIGYYGTVGPQEAYCSLLSLVDTQQGFPRWSALWGYDTISQKFIPVSYKGLMYSSKGYWLEMDVKDNYSPSSNCPYCGDGICNDNPYSSYHEDCESCPEDCGLCLV